MLANDTIYYIHTDHLNTPKVVTDTSQQIVWKGDYKPFGETDIVVENIEFNLRFPGQFYDAETGLNYNYFRSYNPATGRYTQSDPIGTAGGINTWDYSRQSPVMLFDKNGLYPERGPDLGKWGCLSTNPLSCMGWHSGKEIYDAAKSCFERGLRCSIKAYIGLSADEVLVTVAERTAIVALEEELLIQGKRKLAQKLIPGINAVMFAQETGVLILCVLE